MGQWRVALTASDELCLELDLDQSGTIERARLTGVGGPELLRLLTEWRPKLTGPLRDVPLPSGVTSGDLMLRQLLLEARGEWRPQFVDAELCHCRAIPTSVVHQAILSGAHTPELVSRWTSASTACGTCRKDVLMLLAAHGVHTPGAA